ncbi:hypothetical protein GC105_06050 [Alkalibaculum sp. M08DMB]|uniref:Uncharacterized protein n=1 Tax=Alkalibaculum sporogenes TaxID=2655001 RepID=A0A6A7K7H3_9FIRM|nr:hypothetical protein [Alkalibaculum sporogenes]MPW25345.1 hypothetical protein [Alkalibaculum sporogenes]
MSVKARETIKIKSFTYKQLLIIFAILIGLELFFRYVRDRISEDMQFIINISSTIIVIALLTMLIVKVLPRYELMVLEKDFAIYKSFILKNKLVFAVPLVEITSINKKYVNKRIEGKKHNFTLWGVKDRLIYIITFVKDEKKHNVHFHASKKFIEKLEKTINKRLQT